MLTASTVLIDSALVREARLLAAGSYDEGAIPALDPADWSGVVVLIDGAELTDGCHRIIGVARWAAEQGYDLDEGEPIAVPALHVPRDRWEAEHPQGRSTPPELLAAWLQEENTTCQSS